MNSGAAAQMAIQKAEMTAVALANAVDVKRFRRDWEGGVIARHLIMREAIAARGWTSGILQRRATREPKRRSRAARI